ncbi:MAG: type I secretion system permease/ATPase [Magnetococcales bacterium]|nr:type I secretion system permease/ATPase [Magnetococcales bacterium]
MTTKPPAVPSDEATPFPRPGEPEPQRQWPETDASSTTDDPLLHCLATLTRYWQRPQSLNALRAGLPLVENRFTPDLFLRAAARADIAARVVRKPLERISPLTLPVVLLLKDRQACLLMAMEKNGRELRVILPETGSGETIVEMARLKERCTGQVIFTRPQFRFDARSEEIGEVADRHWFWGTLTRFTGLYSEAILASLLLNLFSVTGSLFAMNVYDRVVPNNALETLWVLFTGTAIVYGFDFIIRTLRSYFLDIAGKKADILMAGTLFEQINTVRMAAQPSSSGALARNLLEFESLREFFTSATLSTFIDLPFVLLFLWIIYFLAGDIVLVPLAAVPLILGVGLISQRFLVRLMRKTAKESSQKHAILVETLNGMETIKILGAAGTRQEQWEQVIGLAAQTGLHSRLIASLVLNFANFIQQMTNVGIIVFGVYQIHDGKLTMGALIASSMLSGRALAPLSQVAGLLMRLQQSNVSLQTLNGIMKLPVERPATTRFIHCPKLLGEIVFDNVTFSYPGNPVPVLQNFSLQIRPGERLAILGRIGSGKSTLLKLMLNLYQPDSGTILMDGVDIRQIDPVDLRRNIGCVTQENLLFFGTVRSNILMADPFASDQAMLHAARQAGVDEFVSRHPHGFNRVVGEQGKGLSGGQRQAIAIARALLTNPPLLLMDEPTSSMDSTSEERFKARMASGMQDRTVVLITHKASLLPLVERVVVLDEGKVILDGPRQQIIQQLGGGSLKSREVQGATDNP